MIDQEQPQKVKEPSQFEVSAMIADTLGETETGPRKTIMYIVRSLGRTQAKALHQKTLDIEANGGLMLPDNSRRRTPGGVFFYLAYSTGKTKSGKPLQRTWNSPKQANKPDVKAKKNKETPQKTKLQNSVTEAKKDAVFNWNDRVDIVNEASKEKGSANTVKITVIGRPGKVLDKGDFIVTVIESTKVPALPKGLPTPTATPTKYAVYVQKKQWNKVSEAIKDEDDALIIEGFPKADSEVTAIAVFVTSITTKKLQAALRQSKAEIK